MRKILGVGLVLLLAWVVMRPEIPVSAAGLVFNTTLARGATGEDVRQLQEFLRKIPEVYPEGVVTGYFGARTEKAVKKFQSKYGIEPLGLVGPKTRGKLNELIAFVSVPAPTRSAVAPASSSFSDSNLPECPSETATNCRKAVRTAPLPASGFDPSGGKCEGKGPVQFGASPFKVEQIEIIQPMGLVVGGHVTPIDHGYIFGKGTPDVLPDTFDIQSPAKGYVIELSRTQRGDFSDYALMIEFSCTHFVHYSNMTSFAPKLLRAAGGAVGANEMKNMRVAVGEGELVGRTGAYGIDLYVWDLDRTLTGYVNPKSYATEGWKLHSSQFFDYMKEPLKAELLGKTPRQAEPRFGKIDYDVDGRLVGNWFREGSGGYAGLNHGGEGYWAGHLAVVYDALDPTGLVVSIGSWNGEAKQFGVKGDAPNPKDISVSSGLVKYELLQLDWVVAATGDQWNRRQSTGAVKLKPIENTPNAVRGTALFELVEPRRLKAEFFPGKTGAEVSGFTNAAMVYLR